MISSPNPKADSAGCDPKGTNGVTSPNSTAHWSKTLLPTDATIEAAIRSLNDTGLHIVLVVSNENTLFGTVTDGDIRRGLLRGCNLTTPVSSIAHREPWVVPPELGRDIVIHLMQANRIAQLPIVDAHHHVVGLHIRDDMLTPATTGRHTMVIMAGGRGQRLRPHTENCPKPLLHVNGKPMLQHIVEHAKADGVRHFIISVHYLGHMIEEYFGSGENWGVKIEYLHEPTPLGTAGALSLIGNRPDAPFIVSNGDVLTDIHYDQLIDFHQRNNATATMAVRLHELQNPFGVVQSDGVEITGFEEKPVARTHINAGVYVLDPKALNYLRGAEPCDMPTLFLRCHEQRERTIIYPIYEPWMDVGRIDDLNIARRLHVGASA